MWIIHSSLFYVNSFFRVEWAEKDFLGRLGQRELRWIKSIVFFSLFLKTKYWFIYFKQMTNNMCFSAGRDWCHRKSWTHGRKSKKPWHSHFRFSKCPFIRPTLSLCILGLGGFHRTCGRGGTGRREGTITIFHVKGLLDVLTRWLWRLKLCSCVFRGIEGRWAFPDHLEKREQW